MDSSNLGVVFQRNQLSQPEYMKLYEELKSRGVDVVSLDYSPHKNNNISWRENVKIAGAVGSISFLKNSEPFFSGVEVGSLFTTELHYYSRYQSKIASRHKINSNGLMLPFSEMKQRGITRLLKNLESDEKSVFIKPDQSLKICEAEVVHLDSWEHWCNYLTNHTGVSEDSLMWFSETRKIKSEYRCLVLNGKVLSVSSYGFKEQSCNEDGNEPVINFAEAISVDVELNDPAYMLDIAELEDGSFKFIEMNCFSTSGVYALNTSALADAWISSLKEIYFELYEF